MNLDKETRKEVKTLWSNEFKIFDWETVKRVASNPRVTSLDDLRKNLEKIIYRRLTK